MPFTIRTALPEDAPALAAMNAAFNGNTGVTADEMHLLTGTDNLPAQAAYRRAGFQAKREQYMRKRLP